MQKECSVLLTDYQCSLCRYGGIWEENTFAYQVYGGAASINLICAKNRQKCQKCAEYMRGNEENNEEKTEFYCYYDG